MFVSGITRSNYDTTGAQRLASAESQLNSAIQSGADSSYLLELQKKVDDIKNTINAREKDREKYLNKLSVTERRVQEAQFEQIKEKFDETNARAEARTEKTFDSIRSFSKTINSAFDSLADNVFHTLLGPLQLIVNPLEKALNFNLFGLAKKPVGDFLESKFPATYESLKKNGGLIGAVGVTIVDAINKNSSFKENGALTGDGSLDISSILTSSGLSIASILKGAGIVGLVAAGIAGIITAWKNDWDETGIESAQELKDLLQDEEASVWKKALGVGKYAIKAIFGSIVGGLKGLWGSVSEDMSSLFTLWSDPGKPVYQKIWDTVQTVIWGIPKAIWSGITGLARTLGDYIFGFFGKDSNVEAWWTNFKDQLLDGFVGEIFTDLKNCFSWDNLKAEWEAFKDNPLQWAKDTLSSISGWTEKIITHIISAFTGDPDADFKWAETRLFNFFNATWTTCVDILKGKLEKPEPPARTAAKSAEAEYGEKNLETAWEIADTAANAETPEEQNDARAAAIEFLKQFKETDEYKKNVLGAYDNVYYPHDAIISKDNDLYVPSPDDNIILTKGDVSTQNGILETSAQFQDNLMAVLKEIASNLRQPTVVNNVASGSVLSFEGFRL